MSASAAAYEIAPASVTPVIMSDLAIGEAAAGWLVSVMYAIAVLTSIPVGVLLDRVDVRKAVTVAALALLVAGLWGWVAADAGTYWPLVASRVLGGLSFVAIWIAGANLAAWSVPGSLRATAVGVFTASGPAGFALGQVASPAVQSVAGWPAIFPAYGSLAVVGIVAYRWGTARQRATGADPTAPDPPDWEAFRSVLSARRVWLVCAMGFVGYALYLFLNSWLPTFLGTRFELSLAESGGLVALLPAVGIVARTAGGALSDRVFAGQRKPVTVLSFLVAAPLVVAIGVIDSVAVVAVLIVVAGGAIQLCLGLLFSYVGELVDDEVAGTAVAILTSVALLGALLAPIAAGLIAERTGSFWLAFAGAGLVGAAGVLFALATPEPN